MNVFSHSGDLGDVIYSLPVIRALGGGDLVLTATGTGSRVRTREPMTRDKTASLAALLRVQPYIRHISFAVAGQPERVTHNLDKFRGVTRRGYNELLVDWQLRAWELPTSHRDEPWLTATPRFASGVIVARSSRWQTTFPWQQVVDAVVRRGRTCGFVGTTAEHADFCGLVGRHVHFHRTDDFLQLASVIAGAGLFIGNQSAPLAVALGLGKTCVIEAYPGHEDCSLPRPNVIAFPPNTDPAKLVADLLGSPE